MRIQFSACRLLKVDASSVTTSPMEGVGARKVAEVARILRTLAARIGAGEQEGRAIDCNGNTCGLFSIGEEGAPCRS